MPSSAAALLVSADDQAVLRRWANATLVRRAWILLLAAEGVANTEIAERLGTSRPTVIARRRRYAREGLTGQLADRPRRGRPQTVRRDRRAELLATTLARPPEHAIVVCVDEKSQIQALERTQPVRAVKPGRPERYTC
jgi:transposase